MKCRISSGNENWTRGGNWGKEHATNRNRWKKNEELNTLPYARITVLLKSLITTAKEGVTTINKASENNNNVRTNIVNNYNYVHRPKRPDRDNTNLCTSGSSRRRNSNKLYNKLQKQLINNIRGREWESELVTMSM